MIIDKFKLFENLSIGAIERGEFKLTLNESEKLDEGVLSSVANFFSRMLGGGVSKIDKILRKYKDNELEYWLDWADARGRFSEADALSKEAKSDPVEKMKYEEQKERVKKLQVQVEEKRKNVNDALIRQANNVIKDSTRLKDYWEMKKAKIDEEVARESFDEVKKSSDNETIHNLFDTEIQRAAKIARQKDENFKKKYGSLSSGKFFDQDNANDELSVSGISIKDLIAKPIAELQGKLKAVPSEKLDDILKYIERESKKVKDQKEEDIKNIKNRVSDKVQQGKDIDDVTKKVKATIDSLQSKIDYIDKLILASKGKTEDKPGEVKPEVKKEDDKKEEPAKEAPKKVEHVVDTTQVKKNFKEAKGTIEEELGDTIDDETYSHLTNDLIALYEMLIAYYTKANKEYSGKTIQFGLIEMAAAIYKYKEDNNLLKKDLSQKELEKQFDKYAK